MICKKAFPVLLCTMFALLPLHSSGEMDAEDDPAQRPAEYNIFQIRETFPGDPVFLYIEAPEKISSAEAVLYNNEGEIIVAGKGFLAGTPYTMIIPLAISTYIKFTQLHAKVTALCGNESHEYSIDVPVQHKTFISETIPLDKRNTGIRTDTSKKRIKQIDTLNAVLAVCGTGIFTLKPFTMPVKGTPRRSSHFGDRRVYIYANGTTAENLHHGIDFAVPTGTPVYACAPGKIVLAENRVSTGWSVVIEHMPGMYSLYYHMDSLNVHKDALVTDGALLGKSGASGLATGPHLHWEIRLNTNSVNPEFFLQPYIPQRW